MQYIREIYCDTMSKYRCEICNVFEYDDDRGKPLTDIRPDTKPEDFPDDWECPICKANKTHLKPVKEEKAETRSNCGCKEVCKRGNLDAYTVCPAQGQEISG
ncbi:rubredoxin [Methanohalophilus euhalobius]|uniref:rubredoxin n=1 Tax=Methanohalophilus euhalobius TaxID=51203 RepID=UPI00209C0DC4|nr:rubredoxin [Methanohalophilus euhalobius]